jgi:hypothetical protein
MEFVGGSLVRSKTVYVKLQDGDINIEGVSMRLAEALNDDETAYYILDTKNSLLADTEAAQGKATIIPHKSTTVLGTACFRKKLIFNVFAGKEFWFHASRQVRAVTADDFDAYKENIAAKKRFVHGIHRQFYNDNENIWFNRKVAPGAGRAFRETEEEIARIKRELGEITTKPSLVLPMNATVAANLLQSLACLICKGSYLEIFQQFKTVL